MHNQNPQRLQRELNPRHRALDHNRCQWPNRAVCKGPRNKSLGVLNHGPFAAVADGPIVQRQDIWSGGRSGVANTRKRSMYSICIRVVFYMWNTVLHNYYVLPFLFQTMKTATHATMNINTATDIRATVLTSTDSPTDRGGSKIAQFIKSLLKVWIL